MTKPLVAETEVRAELVREPVPDAEREAGAAPAAEAPAPEESDEVGPAVAGPPHAELPTTVHSLRGWPSHSSWPNEKDS
jgi:hypothetical protein